MWPLLFTLLASAELDVDTVLEQLEALKARPSPSRALVVDTYALVRTTGLRGDPRLSLDTDETGAWIAEDLFAPQEQRVHVSGVVGLFVETELTAGVGLRLLVDTGELALGRDLDPPMEDSVVVADGRPLAEQLASGAFMREAALTLGRRSGMLVLGRQRVTVARGLVVDDVATGAQLQLRKSVGASAIVRTNLGVTALGHTFEELGSASPLVTAELALLPSLFEELEIFGAFYSDRSGLLDDVVQSMEAESIVAQLAADPVARETALTELFLSSSSGNPGRLGYVGASLDLALHAMLRGRLSAVLSRGTAYLTLVPEGTASSTVAFPLSGWAVAGDLSYDVTPALRLSALGLALSDGFVALAPNWTWSGLFFTGGLGHALWPGRAVAAGVNGHGVAAGGVATQLAGALGRLEVRALYLRAMAPLPVATGGRGLSYGLEVDGIGEWRVSRWLSTAVEVDVLPLGDFFPVREVAWRALGQVYVHLGT